MAVNDRFLVVYDCACCGERSYVSLVKLVPVKNYAGQVYATDQIWHLDTDKAKAYRFKFKDARQQLEWLKRDCTNEQATITLEKCYAM